MTGITKSFPGVLALDAVDFEIRTGEIRALMGENGAGKSTLIKVLTGVYDADQGSIELDGSVIRPSSPSDAQALGISTVYQEINLAPNLSVAENIGLGIGGPIVKWRLLRARAERALDRLKLKIDVDRPVGEYSVAIQQLVAIARAIDREAKVLVLDEPTSSLDRAEASELFTAMRSLRDSGLAIVFVTHFLEQVYEVSDSITVLRNGKKVGDWPTASLTKSELVSHMLGRSLESIDLKDSAPTAGEPLIFAENIGKRKYLEPLSLTVRKGEVVGLAGLLGSGRTETINLLFGSVCADSGQVNGASPASHPAVKQGWGLCPEDRKVEGIFPGLSVKENIAVVLQAKRGWFRPIPRNELAQATAEMIDRLRIKTPNAEKPIDQLSGGNQQKTILSRWLVSAPNCLFLDEPTRGIDVGAKLEVCRLVRDLAGKGMAFVFTSSELEEVAGTCDRVYVLRDRKLVGELAADDVSEDQIMEMISS